MAELPQGWPEDRPFEPMTRERFEQLLLGIRDACASGLMTSGAAVAADQRAVWHAAEVALGVLRPGYVPKREALEDVVSLLHWLAEDDDDDEWTSTD